ncbi:MAG: fasciclin domain-containing protein [Chloroflexi bacterium]|nr:fasciclin domain-containing protein [Chloroflexota bacterium]
MRNANPAALVLSAFGIALAVGLAVMIIGFTGYMAAARYRIFQPTVVVVPTATKILERRLRLVDFTLHPKVSPGPGIRLAAAQKDQLLRMGGLVHTVAGSAARFAVSNEGELYVAADSLVGVTELPAGINDKFTLLTLLTGEVFVALSEGTLQVQTPLALVEIRASAMRVSYDAKTLKEINASLRLGGLAEDSVDFAILTGEKGGHGAGAAAEADHSAPAESTPEAAAADGHTDPVAAAPAEPARMTITLLDSTGILRIKQQEYLLKGGRTYVITKDGLLTPEGTPIELDALPIWLEVLPSSSAALRALMPTAVPTATSTATEQPAATTTSAAPATAVTIATAAASATVVASPVPSATLAASATVVVSPTAPVSGTATLEGSATATPAASPAAGTTPTPSPTAGATTDIMSTLRADATRFSTLINALEKAGLAPTFSTGNYTLFAPTNTAFSSMPTGALDFLLVDTTGLARLLKYHALGTSLNTSGITASQSVTSLAGVAVTARKDGTQVYYGTATVSQADITCTNGVIHVIDSVLYPVPAS